MVKTYTFDSFSYQVTHHFGYRTCRCVTTGMQMGMVGSAEVVLPVYYVPGPTHGQPTTEMTLTAEVGDVK